MTVLSYRQSIGPFKWTTLLTPISIIAIATPVMGYRLPEESEARCLTDVELVDLFSQYVLHSRMRLLNKSRSASCNASI